MIFSGESQIIRRMVNMKNTFRKHFIISIALLVAFTLWTAAICFIDVRPIGPDGTSVGFATVNSYFHNLTGVNFTLYTITDWLGLVPVFTGFGFGMLGLLQWIRRKKLLKVDYSIRILGLFYIAVTAAYLFFEEFVINYRPVLINGYAEASYPSSTTLLVLCVMSTAIIQFNDRIKNHLLRKFLIFITAVFIAFMVFGRLICGVHWLTDIVGGALLSAGLVMMYYSFYKSKV